MVTALNAGVFTFTSPAVPRYQLVRLGSVTGEFLSFSALDPAVRIQSLPAVTLLYPWVGHLLAMPRFINGSEFNLVETGLSACLMGKLQLMNTTELLCVKHK